MITDPLGTSPSGETAGIPFTSSTGSGTDSQAVGSIGQANLGAEFTHCTRNRAGENIIRFYGSTPVNVNSVVQTDILNGVLVAS